MRTGKMQQVHVNRVPKVADDAPLPYPAKKLIGVFPTPAGGWAAIQDLVTAGFSAKTIEVFHGQAGAERIHATVDRPGLFGRLAVLAMAMSDELDYVREYEQALHAGYVLVVLPVDGMDARQQARDILRRHRGASIRYFGRWAIETAA